MSWMYELCDILDKEIDDITRKGTVTPGELDMLAKEVCILKDVETIKAMREAGDDWYNEPSGYNDYRMMPRSSARRGRDSMGRYTSRDDEKDNMRREIDNLQRRLESMR